MANYKKITVFLNEEFYKEILDIIEYRNKRVQFDKEDKKVSSVEEFVTGSVIQVLKWLKGEDSFAGIDDLGKPYRLENSFKKIMLDKGMRAKDLAEITNIHAGNISIILNNRSQPSLDYFLRIWIALGCPPLNECLHRIKDAEPEES
ncbi:MULTISPECIES: helix-turn-helix transcriptional regulator [unclassified Bacillus (in: firmicutes)]|uniref:helix-turn-helix domain-containing protein n=1 Tax=unclassified Bacillus (in: firmicutes) TaxID=185979 RepID=UPI001BE9FB06|nr:MULTISPECIES: helix-turn-helix transcriptional regulator [unclassified Bacillus (in: firmicutes)]MBT2724853.1 helix-turn-helix transcriptional regulator [Bacillus sp. ISL-46]MBT2730484.1 helix-turn-helix transcriptional regulator [Bacillus sp. ISL-75]